MATKLKDVRGNYNGYIRYAAGNIEFFNDSEAKYGHITLMDNPKQFLVTVSGKTENIIHDELRNGHSKRTVKFSKRRISDPHYVQRDKAGDSSDKRRDCCYPGTCFRIREKADYNHDRAGFRRCAAVDQFRQQDADFQGGRALLQWSEDRRIN